jgi:hypothetical protein
MAKFTVELGQIIASGYDLGMTAYPIFSESYRAALNAKIKEHFYFREIGFETAGKFKRYLNMTLNEVMPYYNKLYNSELLTFNPLHNTDLTEDKTQENSSNSATVNNNQVDVEQIDDTLQVHSDTPGGLLTADNIKSNTWASDAARQDNTIKTGTTGVNENTNAANAVDIFVRHVAGNTGLSNSQLLTDFRATLLNIDMQVIHELDSLFMGVLE